MSLLHRACKALSRGLPVHNKWWSLRKARQQYSEGVYFQTMLKGAELDPNILCTPVSSSLLRQHCWTHSLTVLHCKKTMNTFSSHCSWKQAVCFMQVCHRQTKPQWFLTSGHPGFLAAFRGRHSWVSGTALGKLASFSLCCHGLWIVWGVSLLGCVVCLWEGHYHLKT